MPTDPKEESDTVECPTCCGDGVLGRDELPALARRSAPTGPSVESAFKDRQAETSVDLEALDKLLSKGTAGEWRVWGGSLYTNVMVGSLRVARYDFDGDFDHPEARANADLAVALRRAAPSLIAELRARRSTGQRTPTGQLFKDQVAATFDQKAAQEQAWALEPGRSQESGARCAERAATWRTARDFVKALPVPAPTGQQEAGAAPAVVPARDCLVCPNRAVRGLDVKGGALWCWRHGPFYDSDLFFPHRPPSAPQEGLAEKDTK